MGGIKEFLLKSAGFTAIVVIAGLMIEGYLDNTNFPELDELRKSIQNNTQIIYFGDSTMRWTGLNDTDTRPIGDMLRNILENGSLSVISNNAYHLGIYEEFSKYICESEKKPQLVIFPINLRSFSPEWDTRPQYQFKDEIKQIKSKDNVLENFWNRFSRVFGGQAEGEDEIKWKNQIVYYNTIPVGRVIDFNFKMTEKDPDLQDKIRKKFIYHYLYTINSTHRKLLSLGNTIKNYKNCGVNLLVYITPIDYQSGTEKLPDFKDIVSRNIEAIVQMYKNELEIKDLSFSLSREHFTYALNPNEHMDDFGRRYVAVELSDEIKTHSLIIS